jgi:hypothetical protein
MPVKRKAAAHNMKKQKPNADFATVFSRLREVMKPYGSLYNATTDSPKRYYLETRDGRYKGKPMMFGCVMMGKAYVSYHLFPLYVCPELKKTISKELKKRMQGKSCFNFKETDEPLFKQLAELTAAGHQEFAKRVW